MVLTGLTLGVDNWCQQKWESKITELVNRKYTYANLNSNLEDIKTIMKKNKIITLPVIDSNKKILGLIQFYEI